MTRHFKSVSLSALSLGVAQCFAAVFLSGCGMAPRIHLRNATPYALDVMSGPDQSIETRIRPEDARTFYHWAGPITIATDQGTAWSYDNIEVGTIGNARPEFKDVYWNIRGRVVTAHLLVKTNGFIYVLPAAWRRDDASRYATNQPQGFPLVPAGRKSSSPAR